MPYQGPEIKQHIKQMEIYPVGDSTVPGFETIINLASNENSMPLSNTVLEALRTSLHQVHRYADNTCTMVIRELARIHGINTEHLVCGNGSSELIYLLTEVFVGVGDNIVIWKH